MHESWEQFERETLPLIGSGNAFLFSKLGKHGETSLHRTRFFDGSATADGGAPAHDGVALVFGSEQRGLDGVSAHALSTLPRVFFPMSEHIRSYNLSTSVAMGLSEAARQLHELQDLDAAAESGFTH